MHFTKNSIYLLIGASAASAIPLESTLHRLAARGAKYQASCDRVIPGGNGKTTYKDKANAAFADAGTLSGWTQRGESDFKGNAFTESTAYSHYFADRDKTQVTRMMQVIFNSRLPVDDNDGGQGYFFDIHCGSDQDEDTCGSGQVLAGTNAKPGVSSIVLCDLFFKSNTKQTNQDINSKIFKSGRRGWCNTNEIFPYFEVAGLTLFHEMTHMHDVGQRAGLVARRDPSGYSSSGTVDIYVKGGSNDVAKYKGMEPWQAARQLKRFWDEYEADNTKYKPTTETIYNAESYAAAALEFIFLARCKWDVILPL